jgi:hypothetical protein
MNEHAHNWIANSGRGGPPIYKTSPNGPRAPRTMHVRCDVCGARTWLTEPQWSALPRGEIINPHVMPNVEEPKPDFDEMNRALTGGERSDG